MHFVYVVGSFPSSFLANDSGPFSPYPTFFLLLLSSGDGVRGGAKLLLRTQSDEELSEALDAAEAWDVKDDEAQQAWRLGSSSTWGQSEADEDQEDHHPAEEMLAHLHADGSKSYILSGY